jgi:hypothetical protein
VRARLTILLVGVLLSSGPALAQEAPVTRFVLAIDRSVGELDDPAQRSIRDALEIFAGVARPDDRVALIRVGGEPQLDVPPLPAQGRVARRRFSRALARLKKSGPRRGLRRGVEVALDSLGPRHPDTQDALVLLLSRASLPVEPAGRDGEPSTRDGSGGWERVVADARVRGVAMHVVALGSGPDEARLKGIARRTGGTFSLVEDAGRLHRTLFHLAVAQGPVDLLPTEGGAMFVDEEVDELALVVSRSAGTRSVIHRADETQLTASSRAPGVSWTARSDFDLVLLRDPVPGAWRIEQPQIDHAVVVVRRAWIDLEVRWEPEVPILGTPARVRGRLVQDGHTVRSFARLKELQMSFLLPDGVRLPLRSTGDGWFEATWVPESEGVREGTLVARSPRFRRAEISRFIVDRQCFRADTEWEPDGVLVRVSQERACSDLAETSVQVRLQGAGSEEWTDLPRDSDGVYAGRLSWERQPSALAIRARTYTAGKQRWFPLPDVEAPEGLGDSQWSDAVSAALANTPLLLVPLVFVYRRRLAVLETP